MPRAWISIDNIVFVADDWPDKASRGTIFEAELRPVGTRRPGLFWCFSEGIWTYQAEAAMARFRDEAKNCLVEVQKVVVETAPDQGTTEETFEKPLWARPGFRLDSRIRVEKGLGKVPETLPEREMRPTASVFLSPENKNDVVSILGTVEKGKVAAVEDLAAAILDGVPVPCKNDYKFPSWPHGYGKECFGKTDAGCEFVLPFFNPNAQYNRPLNERPKNVEGKPEPPPDSEQRKAEDRKTLLEMVLPNRQRTPQGSWWKVFLFGPVKRGDADIVEDLQNQSKDENWSFMVLLANARAAMTKRDEDFNTAFQRWKICRKRTRLAIGILLAMLGIVAVSWAILSSVDQDRISTVKRLVEEGRFVEAEKTGARTHPFFLSSQRELSALLSRNREEQAKCLAQLTEQYDEAVSRCEWSQAEELGNSMKTTGGDPPDTFLDVSILASLSGMAASSVATANRVLSNEVWSVSEFVSATNDLTECQAKLDGLKSLRDVTMSMDISQALRGLLERKDNEDWTIAASRESGLGLDQLVAGTKKEESEPAAQSEFPIGGLEDVETIPPETLTDVLPGEVSVVPEDFPEDVAVTVSEPKLEDRPTDVPVIVILDNDSKQRKNEERSQRLESLRRTMDQAGKAYDNGGSAKKYFQSLVEQNENQWRLGGIGGKTRENNPIHDLVWQGLSVDGGARFGRAMNELLSPCINAAIRGEAAASPDPEVVRWSHDASDFVSVSSLSGWLHYFGIGEGRNLLAAKVDFQRASQSLDKSQASDAHYMLAAIEMEKGDEGSAWNELARSDAPEAHYVLTCRQLKIDFQSGSRDSIKGLSEIEFSEEQSRNIAAILPGLVSLCFEYRSLENGHGIHLKQFGPLVAYPPARLLLAANDKGSNSWFPVNAYPRPYRRLPPLPIPANASFQNLNACQMEELLAKVGGGKRSLIPGEVKALVNAARIGDRHVCAILLSSGILRRIDANPDGVTILRATLDGKDKEVQSLFRVAINAEDGAFREQLLLGFVKSGVHERDVFTVLSWLSLSDDQSRRSIVSRAVSEGDSSLVDKLLSIKGFLPGGAEGAGKLLFDALSEGKSDLAEVLLRQGAPANFTIDSQPGIFAVIEKIGEDKPFAEVYGEALLKKFQGMKNLLSIRRNIDTKKGDDLTPFAWAARCGSVSTLDFLWEKSLDSEKKFLFDARGESSALHQAVAGVHDGAVRWLCQRCEECRQFTGGGHTPHGQAMAKVRDEMEKDFRAVLRDLDEDEKAAERQAKKIAKLGSKGTGTLKERKLNFPDLDDAHRQRYRQLISASLGRK